MGRRIYKTIRSLKLQKAWLSEDKVSREVEITDEQIITRFRDLVLGAAEVQIYHGSVNSPRYFVEVKGRRPEWSMTGEVQRRYAYFGKQRLYVKGGELWKLLEENVPL